MQLQTRILCAQFSIKRTGKRAESDQKSRQRGGRERVEASGVMGAVCKAQRVANCTWQKIAERFY